MIDRITKNALDRFQEKFDFDSQIKESDLFEHFINYIIIENKLDDKIDKDILEKINIGKDGTIGIDGFCILVNGTFIDSLDNLRLKLEETKCFSADVFFIQSKTSECFTGSDISNFGEAVNDFISEKPEYQWSDNALELNQMFQFLVQNGKNRENINCNIYYCTLGNFKDDKNLSTRKKKIEKSVKEQKVFDNISFEYMDHSKINDAYKKIGRKISKEFKFQDKQIMPDINGVKEAYIGLIPVKTIIDLISEDGELIPSVFYDNVRDFQGIDKNKVNNEIEETINDDSLKHAFSILNNGITILSEEIKQIRNNVEISNYQIINGLQTSRVLFHCKDKLDDNMYVVLKLIASKDENIISHVIRATNRQTAVNESDLIAYTEFQKKLEDYFKTFVKTYGIYYERRSKQYNNTDIKDKDIIDKTTLIKVICSFYFEKPNVATRYFGKLFDEFKDKLFKDDHKISLYYSAIVLFNKLNDKFSSGQINRKYRKLRFFILMMMKFEYGKLKTNELNYKKADSDSDKLLDYFDNEENFNKTISDILAKIDSLDLNLQDSELSKSSDLVRKIIKLY